MFTKEKYCKNNQALNYSGICKNIISSNKYNPRTYQKTKNQILKKNKCDRLWKKQSSNNYWTEKENDKNNSNYNYNKKFYYDGKRKPFKYQKKLSHSEFIYVSKFNEENINNKKNGNKNEEEDIKFKKEEDDSKEEISRDDKNNSIEYTITTAYSNSISGHEDSNNNAININENLNIDEFKLNSNNVINKLFTNSALQNQFFQKRNSIEDNKQENVNLNKEEINDIKNQYFSNSMKNLNFIRINSCPSNLNELSSLSTVTLPKIQNINRYSDNYSPEPYNKYNSINQELNQLWINPIAENTEILNVNVKISKNKNVIFKLRRFDDLFLTVKLFCEINSIDEKFMKPIIIKALCTLNNIYQIFNSQIDEKNIKRLKMMNNFHKNTYI